MARRLPNFSPKHVRSVQKLCRGLYKIDSTKCKIGQILGAAGAVEFITCVKELEEGYIHRTVGYETPDDEMDLNYCKEESHESFTYALSNSLGFGGHNASLLVRKYEE